MNNTLKSALTASMAALMLVAAPQSRADHGHDSWKHEWKHDRHEWHDHGWRGHGRRFRDYDDVVVIREPRYIYREPTYVFEEPVRVYRPRRPAVVIGVDVPPIVIPF